MSLINVQNLTFSYDGGIENVFEDVCFQIDTDWKLGFVGRNGRGKTTVWRTCYIERRQRLELYLG